MTTAGDLCSSALKKLGVLAAGETMTAEDGADALSALNALLDQWGADNLQIYTVTRTTFTITASTQNYAVGTGAVVNVVRPVFIEHIRFQDTSVSPTMEYPLATLTEDQWAGIAQKTITSPFPNAYYYNPTYPTGTISFWPVPTSATLQGVLYAPTAVSEFAALTTTVSLPPGYRYMLITNLALQLAPDYDRQPSPALVEAARDSMATVKRANVRTMLMSMPPGALFQAQRGYYNILTDR